MLGKICFIKDNFFGIIWRFLKIFVDFGKIFEKEINFMKLDFVINEVIFNVIFLVFFFCYLLYEIIF